MVSIPKISTFDHQRDDIFTCFHQKEGKKFLPIIIMSHHKQKIWISRFNLALIDKIPQSFRALHCVATEVQNRKTATSIPRWDVDKRLVVRKEKHQKPSACVIKQRSSKPQKWEKIQQSRHIWPTSGAGIILKCRLMNSEAGWAHQHHIFNGLTDTPANLRWAVQQREVDYAGGEEGWSISS